MPSTSTRNQGLLSFHLLATGLLQEGPVRTQNSGLSGIRSSGFKSVAADSKGCEHMVLDMLFNLTCCLTQAAPLAQPGAIREATHHE